MFQEGGNDGKGNDEFDVKDREQGGLDSDGDDSNGNGADPDREPLLAVATVKVDFHGDVPGTLEVDLTQAAGLALTSEGEPIVYVVDPANPGVNGNGIFGYVESGANPGYQDGEDRLVFEVRVDKDKSDSEFKVTFTLHDNIDNEAPDFNDDGVPDLLSANEQLLGLPIHFKITNSDGSSVGGTLPIKVEDDKPFFGEVVGVGATMEIIGDLPEDISVTHDETKGAQSDDGADDQSFFDFVPYPPFIEINFPLIAVAADLSRSGHQSSRLQPALRRQRRRAAWRCAVSGEGELRRRRRHPGAPARTSTIRRPANSCSARSRAPARTSGRSSCS